MVRTSLLKRQAKVHLKIAHRQLAMAEALLEKGFYEGSVFPCCHAFEAICSAGIANIRTEGAAAPQGKIQPVPKALLGDALR